MYSDELRPFVSLGAAANSALAHLFDPVQNWPVPMYPRHRDRRRWADTPRLIATLDRMKDGRAELDLSTPASAQISGRSTIRGKLVGQEFASERRPVLLAWQRCKERHCGE
jgi:hypothetical protein